MSAPSRPPGLKERRLSRVRFEGSEQTGGNNYEVGQAGVDSRSWEAEGYRSEQRGGDGEVARRNDASHYTTAPLNIRSSRSHPTALNYSSNDDLDPPRRRQSSSSETSGISPRSMHFPEPSAGEDVRRFTSPQVAQTQSPHVPQSNRPPQPDFRDYTLSPPRNFPDEPANMPYSPPRAPAEAHFSSFGSPDYYTPRVNHQTWSTPLSPPQFRSSPNHPKPVGILPYVRSDLDQNQFKNRRDSDETLHDEATDNIAAGQNIETGKGKVVQSESDFEVDYEDESPRSRTFPGTAPSQKPALQRHDTEGVRREPAREAVYIVKHHTHHRYDDDDDREDMTLERGKGGVLSNLLKLYGSSTTNTWRKHNRHKETTEGRNGHDLKRTDTNTSFATSVAPSRATSCDSDATGPYRRRRANSTGSVATTAAGSDMTDRPPNKRRGSWFRRRSSVLDEDHVLDAMNGKESRPGKSGRRKRALSITMHVADILQRQQFILKLAKALLIFGSPSHRLESQLLATAKVLEVEAQFIHLPSIVIASFGDADTHTSETHFVKSSGALNLGSLHAVHELYRKVVHDEVSVEEGSVELSRILRAPPIYSLWYRVIFSALLAGVIAPFGFDGSFVDALISAVFGACFAFLQLGASKNAAYSNIFEISIATLVSFVSRGLASTNVFCYQAISSAGVVGILPGYAILCGSLELASKNVIAGSVRMVYAIIYALFLGFGIAVGSDTYFLFDPAARHSADPSSSSITVNGLFSTTNNTSFSGLNGTFTFSNNSAHAGDPSTALQRGSISCYRDPSWPWYMQSVSPWWSFLLVPSFSIMLALGSLTPWRSRQFPVMIIIACAGYATNKAANLYIFNRSDVVSFLGAFAIGLMGNLYSRIFKGTAFTVMVPGVLFLVPGGIAAAGGLAMTYKNADGDAYSNGLIIGFRMVQVAIGITVGLFFSSFIVYSFGRKKGAALFAF